MGQNGGQYAFRRRKLPLENVLPTFFGDLTFLGRYVGYISVTKLILINFFNLINLTLPN